MTDFKQRTLNFLEIEWATYIERFNRWPEEEGRKRVNDQGYEQFRDMLAHVLAWWEEGMGIILATAEEREYERKKYDFAVFNAEAVAKYKDWDEAEFIVLFEKTRQKTVADLQSMKDAAWENRRVRTWVNGIFIHHAREHLVALSCFLALDTLENEWNSYFEDFEKSKDKESFLKKQGYERFQDLVAHIIGWWDEGMYVVESTLANPNFTYNEPDTEVFNMKMVEKYRSTPETELRTLFETKRLALIKFIESLPDNVFANKEIESWLAMCVVEHFDEHALDG